MVGKYPDVRGMLLGACRDVLSIRTMLPIPGGAGLAEYTLDCAIHAMFDDCPVKELAPKDIGVVVDDESELGALLAVVAALESIGKAVGWADDPRVYIAHPSWTEVEATAVQAVRAMLKLGP